ncbi:cytochrome c, mono- and diheme variants family [Burkholderiales bacterium JOSHI_001]|nr:cytochrome c, mono- and diheme variants family [Burkholderiales bacterium JOSHI_001]
MSRTWRRRLALLVVGGLALWVSACTRQDQAAPAAPAAVAAVSAAPAPASPAASAVDAAAGHELGRKIWNFRCYFCHGYSGDARTLAATYLTPKPRDFTQVAPGSLTQDTMQQVITHGKPGTAMKGFAGILQPHEVAAVAAFVQKEFIESRRENTRYHTPENGWPDHERHADAFAFARGQIAVDAPWETLSPEQQRGKRLFMSTCITCHDHGRVQQPGAVWETRALSYPRDAYCTSCHHRPNGSWDQPGAVLPSGHPDEGRQRDAQTAAATPPAAARAPQLPAVLPADVAQTYKVHDRKPVLQRPSAQERRGEHLFQANCAFCHAADGTAKSWIGRFLEPHPRDLTDPQAMRGMSRERLQGVIANGLDGTSMPGWKHVLAPADIDAVVAYIHRAFHPVQGL